MKQPQKRTGRAFRSILAGLGLYGCLALVACGCEPIPAVEAAQRGIGTAIFSTGSCNSTPFSRIAPSLCLRTAAGSAAASITINATCTTLDLSAGAAVPSSARAVVGRVGLTLESGTAAGLQDIRVAFFSNSGCTLKLPTDQEGTGGTIDAQLASRASVADGVIDVATFTPIILYTQGATTIYAIKTESLVAGGATAAAFWGVTAFYD
jgi:hypothetical protein